MPLLGQAYNQSSYRFGDDLLPSLQSARVVRAEPGEANREELVLLKLGPRGWGRIYHFRHFYGPGWGEGQGRALSPRAIEAFYKFLALVQFPSGTLPSIFLTDDGGLELCWEDLEGKAVQAAFLPTHVEIYRNADGFDCELPLSEAETAADMITNH